MTISNQSTPVSPQKQARPTYSRLRTSLLKLTPGDSKCRIYCKGSICKYCNPLGTVRQQQALRGLYSTWITEDVLAMGRLSEQHFSQYDIVLQFKLANIRAVFNLEEYGEHAFCGAGVGTSGFSYEPEELMKNNIYYYNFPLPDFGTCAPARLLDIAKVVGNALSKGRIAVHCHAGHGRTGMIIAAVLMYRKGMTAHDAVTLVRSKRSQSVQSIAQVHTLNLFEALTRHDGGMVLPHTKCATCADYVTYSSRFLSKTDLRLFGRVPKVLYVCVIAILNRYFSSVSVTFDPTSCDFNCFKVDWEERNEMEITEDAVHSLLNHDYASTCEKYQQLMASGMNIVNLEQFLGDFEVPALIHFLDYFFISTFHQLATCQEVEEALQETENNTQQKTQDWRWSLYLLTSLCTVVPPPIRKVLCALVAEWFTRKRQPLQDTIENIIENRSNE